MAKHGPLEEARIEAEAAFIYPLAMRGVPGNAIRAAVKEQFNRDYSLVTIKRRIEYHRARVMEIAPADREAARHDQAAVYDSLRLRAEDLLNAKKLVFDISGNFPPQEVQDLDMVGKGIALYGRLLEAQAKLLGLNAPERSEVTVTHLTPQDPAVQLLIAEAEAHLAKESLPNAQP